MRHAEEHGDLLLSHERWAQTVVIGVGGEAPDVIILVEQAGCLAEMCLERERQRRIVVQPRQLLYLHDRALGADHIPPRERPHRHEKQRAPAVSWVAELDREIPHLVVDAGPFGELTELDTIDPHAELRAESELRHGFAHRSLEELLVDANAFFVWNDIDE